MTSLSLTVLDGLRTSLPEPRLVGGFATEAFLYDLTPDDLRDQRVLARLDRLCKKVDVADRIVVGYTADLARTTDPRPVAPEYGALLATLYTILADLQSDPKFLNSALKLRDGACVAPVLSLPLALTQEIDRLAAEWPVPEVQ